jgi:hypothetical protein
MALRARDVICWPKDIIGENDMALQLGALREALLDAGASAEKADKASEEVAGYDSDLKLLKWMVGGVYAVLVILGAPALWLLLRVAAKVGALG